MGRLVQPAQWERVAARGGGLESASTTLVPVGGDTYQDRVAKYIPGEVVAAYVALDRMVVPDANDFAAQAMRFAEAPLAQAPDISAPAIGLLADVGWRLFFYQALPIAILVLGLIFTPLYIRQLAIKSGPNTPWHTQAAVSTFAFLVWAYAIQGGAFTAGFGIYNGTFASALLIIFTLASGLFEPRPATSRD